MSRKLLPRRKKKVEKNDNDRKKSRAGKEGEKPKEFSFRRQSRQHRGPMIKLKCGSTTTLLTIKDTTE